MILKLFIFCSLLLFASCNFFGDKDECMENLQKKYKIVYDVPDSYFRYIVVDSCGAIYSVNMTKRDNSIITSKIRIKDCDTNIIK